MKRIIVFLLIFCLATTVFCFFALKKENEKPNGILPAPENETSGEKLGKNEETDNKEDELHGIWLSCYEIKKLSDGTEKEYTEKAEKLLADLKECKINTVFFQVRAFSDALYFSDIFPSSEYAAKKDGDECEFDVLKLFIECAKKYGIKVHAWVNPFRVSYNGDINSISKSNPAYKMYIQNKNTDDLIFCDKGIYYNPASLNAQRLIIDGIKEIIDNYNVYGVQFDDYFYPDCDFSADKKEYDEYSKKGGLLSLGEWRREQLSSFISSVYSAVKEKSESLVFGISPSAKIKYNYENLYADVEKWCCCDGYIDYIMPQVYYGFKNETMPFVKVCESWEKLPRAEGVRLYCGLALYKCGKADENAGSGKNEWLENNSTLVKQCKYLAENPVFTGFSLFSCSQLLDENATDISNTEIKKLAFVLK